MATKSDITNTIVECYEDDLSDPDLARGQCYDVTTFVQESFDMKKTIFSYHTNDPHYRFNELNQHSDHHANMHYGKVLDFTLRQFDPETPWPFYGTVDEWLSILSKAWDTEVDAFIVDSPDDGMMIME